MARVQDKFVFDVRSTKREKMANGYMLVRDSNLTRATVNKYMGSEIGDSAEPGRVYNLLRAPDELKKAASKYSGLPLLLGHHDDLPKESIIGTIGTDALFDGEFVKSSLVVWDPSAIKAIEDGDIEELSAGYSYQFQPTPGEFNGVPYDGIMIDIEPNHVALVDRGRAGPEVRVADSALADIAKREEVSPKSGVTEYGKVKFADMKNKKYPIDTPEHIRAALTYWGRERNRNKYSEADQKVIGGRIRAAAKRTGIKTGDSAGNNKETCMSKKTLSPLAYRVAGVVDAHLRHHKAADTAGVLDLVANVERKRFAKQIEGIVGTVKDQFGVDASDELRGILKDMEAMPEMPSEDEFPPKKEEPSEDEFPPKKEEPKKEEPSEDEFPPKKEMEAAVKKAGDQLRAEFRDLREAEKVVRPYVGDVDGFHTAPEVYKYALDHLGVDVKDVHPSAYKALVLMAGQQKIKAADATPTVDTQSVYEKFPGLVNLKRGL